MDKKESPEYSDIEVDSEYHEFLDEKDDDELKDDSSEDKVDLSSILSDRTKTKDTEEYWTDYHSKNTDTDTDENWDPTYDFAREGADRYIYIDDEPNSAIRTRPVDPNVELSPDNEMEYIVDYYNEYLKMSNRNKS